MHQEIPVRRRVKAMYAGALLAFLALPTITWWVASERTEARQWVGHTRDVQRQVEAVRGRLMDLRAVERERVLEPSSHEADEYARRDAETRSAIDRFAGLTGDNPRQQANADLLREKVAAYAAEGAVLQALGGTERARKGSVSASHRQALGAIVALLDVSNAEEDRLLALRNADYERLTDLSDALTYGLGFIAAGVLGWLGRETVRRQRQEAVARIDLEARNEELIALQAELEAQNVELEAQNAELARTERQSRTLVENLARAERAAGLGSWTMDRTTRRMAFSENVVRLMGFPVSVTPPLNELLGRVHPDHRERMRELLRRAVEDGEPYDVEYRFLRPDGEWRRFASSVRCHAGEGLITGTLSDVTDARTKDAEMRRLMTAMEDAVEGISLLNTKGRYVRVNPAYARHSGRTPEGMVGLNWVETVHPGDRMRLLEAYRTMLRDGRVEAESRGIRPDGTVFHQQVTMICAYDDEGAFIGHHGFMKDITERKEIEAKLAENARELTAANGRLQEFDRLKSEFLATASHEMRTPLTVIREFANLMQDEVAGPVGEDQRGCLDAILRNCDRLTGLLNDLLDLEKIQSGNFEIDRERLDLGPLLAACRDDFLPKCRNRNHTLEFDVPEDLPFALADGPMVTQVLVNLLGNAHKFTPESGRITLRARETDGTLQLTVEDNGNGMREEVLERIFEAFRQVDRTDTNGPGAKGTGLGLTIARRIVDLHDGRIWAESEPGVGSRFHFTLPLWSESRERSAFLNDRRRLAESRGEEAWLVTGYAPQGAGDLEAAGRRMREAVRAFGRCVLDSETSAVMLTLGGTENDAAEAMCQLRVLWPEWRFEFDALIEDRPARAA